KNVRHHSLISPRTVIDSCTVMGMRRAAALLAVLAAAACTAPAALAADPPAVARVVGPDGATIAASSAQAGWAYPADGTVAQVGDAQGAGDSLRLSRITVLGGRLTIARALIGPDPRVDGLVLDGKPLAVRVNGILE